MAGNVQRNLKSPEPQDHHTPDETFLSLERECEHLAETLIELEERHFALLDTVVEGVVITQDGINRFANKALLEIGGWDLNEVVGKPPVMSMVFPANSSSGTLTTLDIIGDVQKEVRIQCKNGETKDVSIVTHNIRYNQRDAYLTVMTDITEYRRIEVALLESEEKFRVILDSATTPIVYYDLEGNILLINIAGAELMRGSPDSIISKRVHDLFPIEGQGILRRVRRVAERDEAAEYEDKITLPQGERWFLTRFEPVRDAVGSVFAVQTISYDVTEHKHLAEAWRDLSRRLVEVQEQERRHIASELHDQIGQSLTGLQMMFGRIQAEYGAINSKILDEANQVLDELVERVRELSLNLRPSMLDDLGLVPSILWLIERYSLQTGIQVDFRHKGVGRSLPIDVATAAYRIVQESLTNIARHANVKQAAVWLLCDRKTLTVHVQDSGTGFDLDTVRSSVPSSGLIGMRERSMALEGKLKINSVPGQGTDIIAHLPVSRSSTKVKAG
jgi:PAS domain S-box-containing protein